MNVDKLREAVELLADNKATVEIRNPIQFIVLELARAEIALRQGHRTFIAPDDGHEVEVRLSTREDQLRRSIEESQTKIYQQRQEIDSLSARLSAAQSAEADWRKSATVQQELRESEWRRLKTDMADVAKQRDEARSKLAAAERERDRFDGIVSNIAAAIGADPNGTTDTIIARARKLAAAEAELKEFRLDPFLCEVAAEVKRARAKFPSSEGSMTALAEEVGELAKALLDEPLENVRKEAVQVACMAMRVAVDGDPTLDNYRLSRRGARP